MFSIPEGTMHLFADRKNYGLLNYQILAMQLLYIALETTGVIRHLTELLDIALIGFIVRRTIAHHTDFTSDRSPSNCRLPVPVSKECTFEHTAQLYIGIWQRVAYKYDLICFRNFVFSSSPNLTKQHIIIGLK